MNWLEGLPSVPVILAGAIGGCLLALLTARALRLDLALARLGAPTSPPPEEQVQRLAELADVALREGVLSLESRIAATQDDFLIRGIAMAVDGVAPDEIRRSLEVEIDAATAHCGPLRRLILRLAQMPQIATIGGAAAMLCVMTAYGADPSAAGVAAIVGLSIFAAGITTGVFIGPVADRVASHQASLVMSRLLQTEAIALIRTGCDGRTVESRLREMLPQERSAATGLSKAA